MRDKQPKHFEVKVSNQGAGYPPKMASAPRSKYTEKEEPAKVGRKRSRKQRLQKLLGKAKKGD